MKDPADQATIDAFEAPRKSRGGKRIGAGMKQKYGEPTTTLRVPKNRREGLETWLTALEILERLRRDASAEELAEIERLAASVEVAEKEFFSVAEQVKKLANKVRIEPATDSYLSARTAK